MSFKKTISASELNPAFVAKEVQKIIAERYKLTTNCIESSFLFDRTWHHLSVSPKLGPMGKASRVVASAQVFSPDLARHIQAGESIEALKPLIGEKGMWAISAGFPQKPDDFVGRMEPEFNRFVGHVVCKIDISNDSDNAFAFVDPSAQQFHRPERDIQSENSVVVWPCFDHEELMTSNDQGAVFRYIFHPTISAPNPKTDKVLERLAIGLSKSLLQRI